MKVNKSIQRRIRGGGKGANVVGDVNAAVVANTGEGGSSSKTVSRQRIVQRNGETEQSVYSSSVEIEQDGK